MNTLHKVRIAIENFKIASAKATGKDVTVVAYLGKSVVDRLVEEAIPLLFTAQEIVTEEMRVDLRKDMQIAGCRCFEHYLIGPDEIVVADAAIGFGSRKSV